MQSSSAKKFDFDFCISTQSSVLFWSRLMTCSFHVSLLFDLSIKLLSELMILSSALMNSRFAADFGLREREKFRFSIFDLRRDHLWSYWVEWELVLIVRLCSIACQSIWYIICFDRSLSPMRERIVNVNCSLISTNFTKCHSFFAIFSHFLELNKITFYDDIDNISWFNESNILTYDQRLWNHFYNHFCNLVRLKTYFNKLYLFIISSWLHYWLFLRHLFDKLLVIRFFTELWWEWWFWAAWQSWSIVWLMIEIWSCKLEFRICCNIISTLQLVLRSIQE